MAKAKVTAQTLGEHIAHELDALDSIASATLEHTHTDPEKVVRVDVTTQGGKRYVVGVSELPEGVEAPA